MMTSEEKLKIINIIEKQEQEVKMDASLYRSGITNIKDSEKYNFCLMQFTRLKWSIGFF
jgi:predicted small secreted protein